MSQQLVDAEDVARGARSEVADEQLADGARGLQQVGVAPTATGDRGDRIDVVLVDNDRVVTGTRVKTVVGDLAGAVAIHQGVVAVTTMENIAAQIAIQRVISTAAVERVVAIASNHIIRAATTGQYVVAVLAKEITAVSVIARQQRVVALATVESVITTAPIEQIITAKTVQRIVAGHAINRIIDHAAIEHVVVGCADQGAKQVQRELITHRKTARVGRSNDNANSPWLDACRWRAAEAAARRIKAQPRRQRVAIGQAGTQDQAVAGIDVSKGIRR